MESRVDGLAKALAGGRTRRDALKRFGLVLAGGVVGGVAVASDAEAGGVKCAKPQKKCTYQYCANLSDDTANCGACGHQCSTPQNSTATCVSSVCGYTCQDGWSDCDSQVAGCETHTAVDPDHCGGCNVVCGTTNTSNVSCANGVCQFTCQNGYQHCTNNPGDGCETDVATGIDHCGGCNNVCGSANNTPSCANGVCQFSCAAGFKHCTNNTADGCETNIATGVNNCGDCGVVCGNANTNQVSCANGVCQFSCANGFTHCTNNPADGCETNTASNPNHCGGCNVVCGNTHTSQVSCGNGVCNITCANGYLHCTNNPADGCETPFSFSNCGSCGHTCQQGQSCINGNCV
jgi:hypothetical protein